MIDDHSYTDMLPPMEEQQVTLERNVHIPKLYNPAPWSFKSANEEARESQLLRSFSTAVFPKLTADSVYHPPHYARWKMEPIEFIAVNNLPYWAANVIKYVMRYDSKDGLQDLYKAEDYLKMKIRELEGTERFWEKKVKNV